MRPNINEVTATLDVDAGEATLQFKVPSEGVLKRLVIDNIGEDVTPDFTVIVYDRDPDAADSLEAARLLTLTRAAGEDYASARGQDIGYSTLGSNFTDRVLYLKFSDLGTVTGPFFVSALIDTPNNG